MGKDKHRVILLGIDGACWDLLDRFINEGKLPLFARLKKEGSWGVLKSTIPCYSPLAWNSIFTGVNPGKHKIQGFVRHEYGSLNLEPLNSRHRGFPALWNYANYNNIDSLFINIPFSYPPEEVKGVFICGLGVPSRDSLYTYPDNFKSYIKKEFPDYKIDFDEQLMSRKKDKVYFSKQCLAILDTRLSLAQELFNKQAWQIFSLVIRATDVLQHFCWHDKELIREAYEKIDHFLSFLVNNMKPDDTLILVSDHGFSELQNMVHLVNFFLQEGYMTAKRKVKKGINIELLKNIVLRLGGAKFLETLKRNSKLRGVFFKYLPLGKYSYLNAIDWHSSLLSYAEGSGGNAHLNPLFKRDKAKRETLFAQLRERAFSLRDSQGRQVFEDIYKGEELYGRGAPDIIFRVGKGFCIDGYEPSDKSLFGKSKSGYIGMHDEDGIVVFFNREARSGCKLSSANVYDILPTMLYILGLDIPDYLDGRVLKEAFKEEPLYKQISVDKDIFMGKKVKEIKLSDKDEQAVKEKLKSLGYL